MKYFLTGLSVLGVILVAMTASADETIKTTTVVGKPARPSVTIEVSRARMQLGATTPTLASFTKINDASKKDPF